VGARDWSVRWAGDRADGSVACGAIGEIDVPERTVILSGTPGPGSDQVKVSRRISEINGGDCIGNRNEARAVAARALRDLGLTDWTVDVSDESWDANAVQPHGGEQCATFDLEPQTVSVSSVIREPESGWRRFVPGL
jgi:hypothetical protein